MKNRTENRNSPSFIRGLTLLFNEPQSVHKLPYENPGYFAAGKSEAFRSERGVTRSSLAGQI